MKTGWTNVHKKEEDWELFFENVWEIYKCKTIEAIIERNITKIEIVKR
jgi:hypothetical protein